LQRFFICRENQRLTAIRHRARQDVQQLAQHHALIKSQGRLMGYPEHSLSAIVR
jgi:hypothetical protein